MLLEGGSGGIGGEGRGGGVSCAREGQVVEAKGFVEDGPPEAVLTGTSRFACSDLPKSGLSVVSNSASASSW